MANPRSQTYPLLRMVPEHTGVITGVNGRGVLIQTVEYPSVYASRHMLNFDNPHIGMKVQFDLCQRPQMRTPEASNVRRC